MEGPKFRVTKETPHGPQLERVREGDPEFRDLDKGERSGLRGLLDSLGVPLKEDAASDEEDEPASPGRRNFLKTAGAAAIAASIPTKLGDGTSNVEPEPEEPVVESTEVLPSSEMFDAEVEGYEAFVKLRKDEVLYLDASGRPVGSPATLENFVGPLPEGVEVKEGQAEEYLYSIGEVDELGLPVDKIPPRWLNQVQEQYAVEFPDKQIARRMNVVADFQAAYNEADEPELVSKIASGEISSYDEIVSYFVEKPVRGNEEYNRMEYAQKMIAFRSEPDEERGRPAVPEAVQDGLRRAIVGLFAQESKFNAGLVSSAGAAGLAQIKPRTWWEYTREKKVYASSEEEQAAWEAAKDSVEVSLRMDEQLRVVGELMSDNYHYLTYYAGDSLDVLRGQFSSEEEFQRDLVVPLLLNAYNAGGPAIGKTVKEFIDNMPAEYLASGKDLFIQYADFTKESQTENADDYGDDAREYVPRVFGNLAMLEDKYGEQ